MPFNGSGAYSAPSLPGSFNPAISGQDATPDDWNDFLADLELALSTCWTTDGQSTITANQPMSGFKFTGVGDATLRNQYASMGQVQDGKGVYSAAGGTANAITITLAPAVTAYVVGQRFRIKMGAGPNTDAVTVNANTIGAGPVVWPNGVALVSGDIPANAMFDVEVADISTPTAPVMHLQTVATPPSMGAPTPPQGRLTLATGVPVMTTSQASKTTIYYAPYTGCRIPIYNGTAFAMTFFTEMSNLTTASNVGSAGPAAVANNSNYDLFVWVDAGVPTLTRGPLWTSDTARGTGAGTTELVRLNGILTNAVAITNGPAANRGTYVGTVRSDGSAQINFVFGGFSANATAGLFGVWNAYNRVPVSTMLGLTTATWTYPAASAWRAANAQTTARVSMVRGLNEDPVAATNCNIGSVSAGDAAIGIGLDSTTARTGITGYVNTSTSLPVEANYSDLPGLGFHFLQMIEWSSGGDAAFNGAAGAGGQVSTGMICNLAA